MFSFSIDNKEYNFELVKYKGHFFESIEIPYLKFYVRETLPNGGYAATGGRLMIMKNQIVWEENDYLFDQEVKEYVNKCLKMKAFI